MPLDLVKQKKKSRSAFAPFLPLNPMKPQKAPMTRIATIFIIWQISVGQFQVVVDLLNF